MRHVVKRKMKSRLFAQSTMKMRAVVTKMKRLFQVGKQVWSPA